MKQRIFLITIFLFAAVLISFAQTAQPVDIKDFIEGVQSAETVKDVLELKTLLFTIIFTILGYLAPFIPVINKHRKVFTQVVTTIVIFIIGVTLFGFDIKLLNVLVSGILSLNVLYPILKALGIKTKKSEAVQLYKEVKRL